LLHRLTAAELARLLRAREVSAVEVAVEFLERAGSEPYNAFLCVARETALAQAEAAQRLLDAGDGGPLTGVPLAVKDNLSTRGVPTTCASRALEGYVPPFDATTVALAARAGMPMLGKTNLDEFAFGASNETSAFGPALNPWDTARSPGGSSGGSAAAVAGRLAPIALGSDTGGSVRMPAALCGVVGFKPTYGRASRYGLVSFASSLDQVGPIARTVEDAALLAATVCDHDPLDSTSSPSSRLGPVPSVDLKGLRLGVVGQTLTDAVEAGVRSAFEAALAQIEAAGAEIRVLDLPSVRLGVTTYYIIAPAEASSNLARFDGIRFGPQVAGQGHEGTVAATRGRLLGHEAKLRIMVGTYALSAGYYDAYYHRAQQVRTMMVNEFDAAFSDVDAVVSPTCPVSAFKLGSLTDDPLALKLLDLCTLPANMGGYPSVSLPCGLAGSLPVGFLMTGPRMGDERLLGAARAAEAAFGFDAEPEGL
jgi:aspartyl-tRNA(Asn)/glutamyl-tRNA(Gln) amidotransferase subunit A